MRKYRRLEREVGPVRFVARSIDAGLLQMCLDLKNRQYLRTGVRTIFAISWVRDLMHSLQKVSAQNLTGVLSVLFAGDKVVSLHFGMRSASVWHWWFPAYDVAYGKHSPGTLLLLKMAEACSDSGITSIDLGQGNSHYKMRLSNGAHPLMIGSLERTCVRVASRSMVNLARKAVRKTVVGSILRIAKDRWKNAKLYVNNNNTV
jgi:CelD/BcsL family acetyltransferase involved in cellulose biosynthesis